MTLASAILNKIGSDKTFIECCKKNETFRMCHVLEINEAGNLTQYLQTLPNYLHAPYPKYDMQNLKLPDSSFDLVIHSDTLEHVPDSLLALKECKRVLAPGGFLAYTIPIIPDRLTRSRKELPPSFHGKELDKFIDFLVQREYGSDFWRELFEAGFNNIHIHRIVYPASMAIIAEI